jgi:hypothetical protein
MNNKINKNKPRRDSEYYYSQINSSIEKSFSYEQRNAVKSILQRAASIPSAKIVDLRGTFWLFKRFYFVLFIGRDIRERERISGDLYTKIIGYLALLFIGLIEFIIIVFLIFTILYFVKSFMGINIFPDKHLSDFYKLIWF